MTRIVTLLILATVLVPASPAVAASLGTAITYQGQLKQSGVPYAGTADLIFALYDAAIAPGAVVAGPLTLTNVSVVNGMFTVQIDFGAAAFAGNARWIGIQVRTPAGSGGYTQLTPRQAVTTTAYAASLVPGASVSGSLPGGRTLSAINSATNGTALSGTSLIGTGVYGVATGANSFTDPPVFGVYGEVSGVQGAAIYGKSNTPSTIWAGAFLGSLLVAGDLSVNGTKSFRIDHPFDPANKYLMHYCTEGAEPLNVYRGNVTLDAEGQAQVTLPDYFDQINRDPSYQLTAVGAAAPNLHVAAKIADHRFLIAGGTAGQEVSWRVEAVRNDRYVRTYGAAVEKDKPQHERGKYLNPELYGRPATEGIGYLAPTAQPGSAGAAVQGLKPSAPAAPAATQPAAMRLAGLTP